MEVKSAATKITWPWEIFKEKVEAQKKHINELAERVLALERENERRDNYEQELNREN